MGLFRTIGRGYVAYQALWMFIVVAMLWILAIFCFANANIGPGIFLIMFGLIPLYFALKITRGLKQTEATEL